MIVASSSVSGKTDRLLTLAHRLVGIDLRPDARTFLDSYRPLRNQFEHLDEGLPGQERGGRLVLDVPGRMLLGLTDDGTGRITVRRGEEDVVCRGERAWGPAVREDRH